MRVLSVVGARPQFVKLAPIDKALRRAGIEHVIVHTGQHYDPMLSDVFFRDLGISAPAEHLGIGSGSHGKQTGAMMGALDGVYAKHQPDLVLVYGDTNSTLAAAICAAKMHIPLAHLEAGLRSFNRRMPEEHNRVLTDHASDMLFTPTTVGAQHLANEGITEGVVITGDVMTDVLYETRDMVAGAPSPFKDSLGLADGSYSVATIHRAENTDDPERLSEIIESLGRVDHPVVVLAHPRLLAKAEDFGISLNQGNLQAHASVSYPELVSAVLHSRGVITDSGGLQKEAFLLRVPCTTVRPETEWVETVELGWNILVEPGKALTEAASRPHPAATDAEPYGDGHAAQAVVAALLAHS
ncbi:non-hydrolyzing UDP-N-acetylglucosamine 2-epimerase [Actinomyces minihominis]|uniref:non-hydrolyzing UDP-N-acetylglucosamine 2-epimerase n=1 Tax=Actinomyces minihominis TaxID=2002838 RepID=UPI000C073E84|nr:UDP-N-acetylglucosamine 2-epimerase (non-hydrolyzing) [Actinomyces minihominis]